MPPPTATQKPSKLASAVEPATDGASAKKSEDRVAKPDQAAYNAEQDALNKEIAEVKAKIEAVRSRIALGQAPSGNDRRSVIKTELDSLRAEQSKYKADRGKLLDELKRLQEVVGKKIKDAQASRSKVGYKNVAEIDDRIASLNAQVESGSMKLVEEKKALQEITQLRRARKTLESSSSADDSIAADRARMDELRKQLDDPEAKRVNDRFDELKKEMDGLREEGNKAYEERNKLFEERNALSKQMDELYAKKRESAQKFREEGDRYWAKVHADRQARQERFKAEKAKEEAARRDEEITRLREEAKAPAYAAEIEDCRILIGWFTGKYGGSDVPETNAAKKTGTSSLEGIKQHDIRQVESDFAGMQLKKKTKDDDLEGFFGGSKKKKGGPGGKKGSAPGSGTATPSLNDSVNLPMGLLTALLGLGIPPPANKDDVQRVIEDIETKKAWFEANSAAKTKTEIERVEKLIAKLLAKDQEEGGMKEPTHTVAVAGAAVGAEVVEVPGSQLPEDASPNEEVKHVDSALEEIKEGDA